MGGAIVAKIASRNLSSEGKAFKVQGVVVIDVVEGTAMESIDAMRGIILRRPRSFPSQEEAIDWSISSNMIRNAESARVSIPPLLISEDGGFSYVWRTNLMSSEPFWRGWFEGLSQHFLDSKCPRLLILAGTDRLDKALTIAQMQGKFQLALFPQAGHCIQEDAPHWIATELAAFAERTKPLDIAALLRKSKTAN